MFYKTASEKTKSELISIKEIIFLVIFITTNTVYAEGKYLSNIVECSDTALSQRNAIGTTLNSMKIKRRNNLSAAEKLEYKKLGIKPDEFYVKDETYFSLGQDGFNQRNFPGRWIANNTGRPEKCTDLLVVPLKVEITKINPLLNLDDNEFKTTYEQANSGDARQQYNLAMLYGNGKKVEKNINEYRKWLIKSAENGFSQAQYVWGLEHRSDFAYQTEFAWHMKAALQGHHLAQVSVAAAYLTGNGVKENLSEAIIWYEKAAAQNNHQAMFVLGRIYADKDSGKYNLEKAREYYQRAAALGNDDAKRFLIGIGGENNKVNSTATATGNQNFIGLPKEPTIEDANAALKLLSGYDGFGEFCRDGKRFSALLTRRENGKWVLRKTPQDGACSVDSAKKFVFETVHE